MKFRSPLGSPKLGSPPCWHKKGCPSNLTSSFLSVPPVDITRRMVLSHLPAESLPSTLPLRVRVWERSKSSPQVGIVRSISRVRAYGNRKGVYTNDYPWRYHLPRARVRKQFVPTKFVATKVRKPDIRICNNQPSGKRTLEIFALT